MAWWTIPAVLGGQYILGEQQAKRQKRETRAGEERAWRRWEATAFPSTEELATTKTASVDYLAKAKALAGKRIPSKLAARGFGPGSGLMAGEFAELEGGWLEGLGGIEQMMAKLKMTPRFAPPGFQGGEYYPGGEDALQQALGMYLAGQMLADMDGDVDGSDYLSILGLGGR